jgi:hypothetical protein
MRRSIYGMLDSKDTFKLNFNPGFFKCFSVRRLDKRLSWVK